MMETKISDFHTSFYIPAIQKLAFHIPHVHILGTNHCGEMQRTSFKRRELFQDVLCCLDYSERVVVSFPNQIQSEYYGGNRSMSIEGILLEHFSVVPQADINSYTISRQRHALFHSFYLTTENRMLPLLPHTEKYLFHCSSKKSIDNIIEYNLGKH